MAVLVDKSLLHKSTIVKWLTEEFFKGILKNISVILFELFFILSG